MTLNVSSIDSRWEHGGTDLKIDIALDFRRGETPDEGPGSDEFDIDSGSLLQALMNSDLLSGDGNIGDGVIGERRPAGGAGGGGHGDPASTAHILQGLMAYLDGLEDSLRADAADGETTREEQEDGPPPFQPAPGVQGQPPLDSRAPPVTEKPPVVGHAVTGNGQTPPIDQPVVEEPVGQTPQDVENPQTTGGASNAGQDIAVNGGGDKTVSITNNSSREQNYALFTNPTAGMSSSFGRPDGFVTLKPGESANFKLPDQHSGYVQQMNDYTRADYDAGKQPTAENFKASRAEYTFNADGTAYFNASNIDGYNASLKMEANGQVAGTDKEILAQFEKDHPNLIETVGGQKIIKGPQFFSDAIDQEAVRALDLALNNNADPYNLDGNTTTYVLPDDNKAVRGTTGGDLALYFGDA
jgi:hypothetical protein